LGAAFGSYGWSGESPRIIQEWLQNMGMQTVLDPIRIKHVPADQDLQELSQKARTLAESIRANVQA
ncbi:MAG: FprA family A-type flavoprotein, partial [Desulfohalobiaceae bacterium]